MNIIRPGAQQLKRHCTFTVPMCSICNKEVDKFEMIREGEKTRLVAYCHGSTSETEPFEEWQLDRVYTYRAFSDPKRMVNRGRVLQGPHLNDVKGSWVGRLGKRLGR